MQAKSWNIFSLGSQELGIIPKKLAIYPQKDTQIKNSMKQ